MTHKQHLYLFSYNAHGKLVRCHEVGDHKDPTGVQLSPEILLLGFPSTFRSEAHSNIRDELQSIVQDIEYDTASQ